MTKLSCALLIALVLAACGGREGSASAREVEAAVQRSERELVAAEAKQKSSRKHAQAYASLPY